jgi:hypothetical protein
MTVAINIRDADMIRLKEYAFFGRDTGRGGTSYGRCDMTHVLDIDPRIARHCLHAGLLQAGA